ncbi:hypothetical protein G7046_g722 [Stylonectria norvegica]|nr:hypothetical protein G7046_g722 [Stylonectria norvegica]
MATSLPESQNATQSAASPSVELTSKPIHSLVLDTGPLIKNDPSASTLRAKAEHLFTLPSIITEIRDPATRSRVETTLLPFVTLRSPGPDSIKFVTAFARRTGDLAVLSRPDIEVLALGYELECERNGGDWRLRNTPGQKRVNGKPNRDRTAATEGAETEVIPSGDVASTTAEGTTPEQPGKSEGVEPTIETGLQDLQLESVGKDKEEDPRPEEVSAEEQHDTSTPAVVEDAQVDTETVDETVEAPEEVEEVEEVEEEDSDDEGGWITPSNLKKVQAQDAGSSSPSQPMQKVLQAAVLTSDYAMQNVALRMNLNIVAPSLARISHLKNWVLRCHGCFTISKDMNRQFCPSCGQQTLNRVSCSTDEHGNFKVHLKKNFQWNNRGNVYSVPKPVHGTSNGKLAKNAGGKNGWGVNLILAEDQKEYQKASDEQRRSRKKDLMDQDYLPGILSGDRSGGSGKIRVGAGRTVNSKRKK